MTKLEALKELVTYDHVFLHPDAVKELGEPFGICPLVKMTDTRSQPKGLTLTNGKEGDVALGMAADQLAEHICQKLKAPYTPKLGRGSRLRECCRAAIAHLKMEA